MNKPDGESEISANPGDRIPFDFIEEVPKGNLGLAVTYWVYGVLGNIVWKVGFASLDLSPYAESFALLISLCVAYNVWVSIGIWNSANKYKGSKVWIVLAKFAVIVGMLQLSIAFYKWFLVFIG